MSVSIQTDIFCDIEGDNCLYWAHGGPSARKTRIREARAFVAEIGWARVFNSETNSWQDICPNCLKENK